METIQRDYAPKGVRFFYIYKALAHPEHNGYVTPFNLEERLLHVKEAERTLGSRFSWICDTMDNAIKHAFGDAPNSEFIIDPEGKVARRRSWSSPSELRRDLEELVGPVERVTPVSELDLKKQPPPDRVASGIVPRIELPGRMQPLKFEPVTGGSKTPFYVKLRAETTPEFFRQGQGKLYLGFHLDPLYQVHWNNLTDPIQFEVKPPPGVTVSPASGRGPKVEEAADSDPREFLLDIDSENGARKEPLEVTVRYYACDNADTFCIPVTQQYFVQLQQDPDGGRAMRRGRGEGRPFGGFAGRGRSLMDRDQDGDGRISLDEAPEPMRERFPRMDANGDGFLDKAEIESMAPPFGMAGGGPPFGQSMPAAASPLAEILDADNDGIISRRELARATAALRKLDKNRDGQLTKDEYEPARPAIENRASPGNRAFQESPTQREGSPAPEMMRRFQEQDKNSDGKVARDEASGMFLERFDFMDADGNGVVDRKEIESAMERMRRGQRPVR